MKAFLCSIIAMLVIAVGAGVILTNIPKSTADVYQSHKGSVRL